MKALSEGLLGEITGRLTAEFHPEQVWIFGSHAWGTPDEGSDLDLMVVVPESDETPVRRAQRAQGLDPLGPQLVMRHLHQHRDVRASLSRMSRLHAACSGCLRIDAGWRWRHKQFRQFTERACSKEPTCVAGSKFSVAAWKPASAAAT